MSDTPEKSVKPTIPSERVPDFPAMANEFRSDADFALYQDLTQRGDKALRRKLFMAARTFVLTARKYRATFKAACKPLGIKGDNIEGMAIRFLFGPTLDKHAVHDWSCVVKYWRECEPDQQDVEAPHNGSFPTSRPHGARPSKARRALHRQQKPRCRMIRRSGSLLRTR
jgi:hypothetical protein